MKTLKNATPWYEPGTPLELDVAGRPNTMTAHATADTEGVTVSLDDDRHPEFWAQVRLSEGDLVYLLEEMRQCPDSAA